MKQLVLSVWDGEESLDLDNGWIIAEEDEELFSSVQRTDTANSQPVCVVSNKAAERPAAFLKAFQYELVESGRPAEAPLKDSDPAADVFFSAWEHMVRGVNLLDLGKVRHAREVMNRVDPHSLFLWKTAALLEVLEEYVNQARGLIFEGSPIGPVPLTGRRNDWWEYDGVCAKSCDSIVRRVGAASATLTEALIDPLLPIGNVARLWQTGSAEAALSVVWLQFIRAANASMMAEKYNLVVLYVHRALDAYFQMYGLREGVVNAGDGLVYRFEQRERETVTLCETERRLVREAQWLKDKDRASFLWEINRARNCLLETHGVYECTAAEAKISINRFETTVRRIGSPTELAQLNQSKAARPRLSPRAIFGFEEGFDVFILRKEVG